METLAEHVAVIADAAKKIADAMREPVDVFLPTLISVLLGGGIGFWSSHLISSRRERFEKQREEAKQQQKKKQTNLLLAKEVVLRWCVDFEGQVEEWLQDEEPEGSEGGFYKHDISGWLGEILNPKDGSEFDSLRKFSRRIISLDDLFIIKRVSDKHHEYDIMGDQLINRIVHARVLFCDLIDLKQRAERLVEESLQAAGRGSQVSGHLGDRIKNCLEKAREIKGELDKRMESILSLLAEDMGIPLAKAKPPDNPEEKPSDPNFC